jgi:hypothetical protein
MTRVKQSSQCHQILEFESSPSLQQNVTRTRPFLFQVKSYYLPDNPLWKQYHSIQN